MSFGKLTVATYSKGIRLKAIAETQARNGEDMMIWLLTASIVLVLLLHYPASTRREGNDKMIMSRCQTEIGPHVLTISCLGFSDSLSAFLVLSSPNPVSIGSHSKPSKAHI